VDEIDASSRKGSCHFNADFTRFEAMETLIYGPAGSASIVKRRWVARRY
jgi:hypothetical protein